ncbi:MAG: hypothetical protein J7M25_18895 [Deltaproteobacteria bacterium]|nr:hypothetical protein [Deltaproteobacteria bacterium]
MPDDRTILASETLARLYESQGQPERAKALRGRIETEGRWTLVEQGPRQPKRRGRPNNAAAVRSSMHCRVSKNQLSCEWTVLESDIQTARAHLHEELQADATLALRVMSYHREQPDTPVFWQTTDIAPDASVVLESPEPLPLWVTVSVGLIARTGRFQPIAHAPSMTTETSTTTESSNDPQGSKT